MRAQRRKHMSGLTLVEALVAIAILGVGILALAQLQAASLRNSALAESINRTTRLARGELEWQRQTALDPGDTSCSALVPADFGTCRVDVVPCALVFDDDGGAELECGPSISPSTYRVTVSVDGPRGQTVVLSTLWTGTFIAGGAGEVR